MAEERTLGLARAPEIAADEPSKEELQIRMEEARDSISQTVTEIKETVTQQYETVKDALDWREHYKKRPVAWSLGAAGVGFFVGYGLAAAIKGDDDDYEPVNYVAAEKHAYAAQPIIGQSHVSQSSSILEKSNGKDDGPGLIDRFKETRAFDRLQQEVGSLGNRLVEELSTTAQTVVLPALFRKIKELIGADLSKRTEPKEASAGSSMRPRADSGYQPVLERNPT